MITKRDGEIVIATHFVRRPPSRPGKHIVTMTRSFDFDTLGDQSASDTLLHISEVRESFLEAGFGEPLVQFVTEVGEDYGDAVQTEAYLHFFAERLATAEEIDQFKQAETIATEHRRQQEISALEARLANLRGQQP